MKTPPGLLAPLEECSFGLEAEERERLAELRAEKQRRLREGNPDYAHEPGTFTASRARNRAANEAADTTPEKKEDEPVLRPVENPCEPVPAFRVEWVTSKPGPKPPGETPPATGLDALTATTRRVYDVFQELAPGGSGPVRQSVVADKLNVTAAAVAQHVAKLRAAGVYHEGWSAGYGPNGCRRRSPDASPMGPPRKPKPGDPATPAEQSVLDVCERLAPGGSRPVKLQEIADILGITKGAVGHLTRKLRGKGLYLAGWVIEHGHRPKRPKRPEVSTADAPPADSPAARSIASHATKYRITADERRARERDAETSGRLSREIREEQDSAVTASDPRREQVGGDHYTRLAVQPWDVIEATFGPEGVYAYFAGNVVKYLIRAHSKGGIEDIRKARHYLDRLETLVESGKAACGKVRSEDAT